MSQRFGSTKQTVEFAGEALVKRSVRLAEACCKERSLTVTGHDWQNVLAACGRLRGFFVHNEDFAQGLGSSISCATRALSEIADAILLLLADQPRISASHLQALVHARQSSPQSIIASAYAGTMGPPVIFPRRCFAELMQLKEDVGARQLLRRQDQSVVSIPFENAIVDIDTPGDLETFG
jgi:molybdenum cofactor cytidylyltransferase